MAGNRIRTLCAECAEEVGKQFDLRCMTKRDIKCSCERCRRRKGCRIYEYGRKAENHGAEASDERGRA